MSAADFPIPDRDLPALQPFWLAAAQHRLELPRCNSCSQFNWYPSECCRFCDSTQLNWLEVEPRGTLFSWSVVQRPLFAPYALIAPYIPVIVELSAAPDVRLVTRLIDAESHLLAIGAPIEMVFADLTYPHTDSGVIAPLAKLIN